MLTNPLRWTKKELRDPGYQRLQKAAEVVREYERYLYESDGILEDEES